ncbi:hypothetical protein DL1_06690 [Thioclava dalianensis]|uniref:HTH luxR-type domain-containing protein n=1 Tax=Thioclava dalianensis TaxID=1185766 RepID=A0A074TIH5_9RHOB|nr:alpha/beta hydrolase [Thioclava dalianensis]KEP71449.1 hypothetical protein DL1_06690 [Thioclava dalianensis]
MNRPARAQPDSHFLDTLVSVLPADQVKRLPREEDLLSRSERDTASERFFHRHFAHCAHPTNLYDRSGARQVEPFIETEDSRFPAMMLMPQDSAGGCAFVVQEETLFFLYDRIERWADAPAHLSFIAVRIGPEEITSLCRTELPGTRLSRSEYLLLAWLLSGHTLKDAAAELGASYDTKRKQVQLVLDKFGAESQTSLLRKLALEITAHLLDDLLPKGSRREEAALVKRQYGRDVVINTIAIGEGLEVPIWEFGARGGQPILYFHNMLSPILFREDMIEVLRAHGLRWLVVPRHFLSTEAPHDADQRMVHLTRALAETMDYLTDAPLICLGDSAGVSWAVHFARHNPDMVAHLMLSATPQPVQTLTPDHRPTIYAEMSDRLRRDERVTSGMARVYNALARVPMLARRGLRHLYRQSPPDLATLDTLFAQPLFFDWLRLIANVATHSSMEEMRNLQRNWLTDLQGLDCAVTFLHGAQDTISPFSAIETLAETLPKADFLRLENAGHFVLSQHFEAFAAHAVNLPEACKANHPPLA